MIKPAPDFLIIGAAKSGTTSLIADLKSHPEIFTPGYEIEYFSYNHDMGDDWYRSVFTEDEKVQGEKSPSYLFETGCHERIFRYHPGMKLIVLLREPVQRAFSNWTMRQHVQHRLLKQSHEFNQRNPVSILNIGFSSLFEYYRSCPSDIIRRQRPLDIFERSLYLPQIQSILNYFQRDQLLILIAEHYFSDPARELQKICRFLNIGDFRNNDPVWKRKTDYRIKMNESDPKEMQRFYKPYNEALFDFLGYEIAEWNKLAT